MARTKEVTLPNSGDVVTIKKPGPLGLSALLGGIPSASALVRAIEARKAGSDELDEDAIASAPKDTINQMVDLVCACAVKPKISRGATVAGSTDVDDIEWGDFIFLFNEVYKFAGFEEAVEKIRPSLPTATAS